MNSDSNTGARMFDVTGLPNINIPVPPREVLEALLGIDRYEDPLRKYLQQYLTTNTLYGAYQVVVNVGVLKQYIEVGSMVAAMLYVHTEKGVKV